MRAGFIGRVLLLCAAAVVLVAAGLGFAITRILEPDLPASAVPGPAGNARVFVWGALACGFGVLYAFLFLIIRRSSRLIQRNEIELKRSRARIESQRLELLNRIGTAAMRELGPSAVLREIAQDIRRLLAVPRVTVRLFGDPDTVVEDLAAGVPPAAAAFPPRLRGADGSLLRCGERLVVSNAAAFSPGPGGDGELWERVRLGSLLAVPICLGDDAPVGVLIIEKSAPHEWAPDEVAVAEALSRQAGMAIRHARVFAEQKELAGRLTSLVNNVPGLVYRGLPDWTMPVVGENVRRVLGYPAETFTRQKHTWKEIVHPDDLPAMQERIREAVRRRETVLRLEYRVLHGDGTARWVSDRRQMIYGDDGRLEYVDGLILDITERKKSEQMLRLTQFSVDRAGDAAYWMDEHGRLLYVNEQACRALGYAREELLAMTIHDINPDFPPEVWPDHWEGLRERRSYTFESRHRRKDGLTIPVEITVNYIEFDGKGYNCASARDITERKRAQAERERLQQQLMHSQKMEALGILAGGIAHDFNNLLTGILGYANLLLVKAQEGSETAAAAGVIQRAAERASELTAQLLGFARRGKNLAVPVDLQRIVDEVVVLLDRTMGKRVTVEKAYGADGTGTVGDPGQLHQVVLNLGVNAYEAMPGGGTMTVETAVVDVDERFCLGRPEAAPGRYFRLVVRDTGTGIPHEIIGKIFDPFFTTKETGRGSGLGLATVFGIVRNHGGFVDVESRPGEGSAFSVFLPAVAVPASAGDASERTVPVPDAGRGGAKILVVDDQEAVREVCAAMLRSLGYEVETASDGREGLAYYRENFERIDLVIVDMIMPNMDGRECFRGLREINPSVRAVLSTGYSLEGSVQETLAEGMAGFIQKPYRLETLAEVVAKALGAGCEVG